MQLLYDKTGLDSSLVLAISTFSASYPSITPFTIELLLRGVKIDIF
jgi:hypothetical protein